MSQDLYTHRMQLWTQLDKDEIGEKLDELRHVTVQLENDKRHAVVRARALGLSWEQIGQELNMTRQAAWERWHRYDSVAGR